jgi:CheY-like chemotaxis protein
MTSRIENKRLKQSPAPGAVLPTVLVVEDFDDFRFMLRLRLELSNYRVVEAANGCEAVEVAQRERPSLVVMDLCLPVLDGFAATRQMRDQPSLHDVPIVALTAHGTSDYRNKAAAAGCNEFLTKPLNFERLQEVMTGLLRPRELAA